MLKNLALWVFVTSSGQTIGINFWATHAPIVPRTTWMAGVSPASDQQLVAGVEATACEKKSSALGATFNAAPHVMSSTRWGAAIRAVCVAVVWPSQIRLAVQKKYRPYATHPRAAWTSTDIAAYVRRLRTRVLHFARERFGISSSRPRGKSAINGPHGSIFEYRGGFSKSIDS